MTRVEHTVPTPSAITRLLEELSWGGNAGVARLRGGGRSLENVLTTEVLQALDFLPRTAFLARVFRAAEGADRAREEHARSAEDAVVTVLPGPTACGSCDPPTRNAIEVQPDAIIDGPTTYAVVEAKRNGAATFGPHQIARELAHTLLAARPRLPLLLLIVNRPPPIHVQRHGKLGLVEAVDVGIDEVLAVLQTEGHTLSREEVLAEAPNTVAWITWAKLQATLREAQGSLRCSNASIAMSMDRIASCAIHAIDWHKR